MFLSGPPLFVFDLSYYLYLSCGWYTTHLITQDITVHTTSIKVVSLSVRCYVQLYPKSQCGHVIKIQDQDSIKGKTLPVPDQTMLKTTSKAKCYLIQTNYTQDYLRDNITLFQSKPNSRISRRQNVTLFQLFINLRYFNYIYIFRPGVAGYPCRGRAAHAARCRQWLIAVFLERPK